MNLKKLLREHSAPLAFAGACAVVLGGAVLVQFAPGILAEGPGAPRGIHLSPPLDPKRSPPIAKPPSPEAAGAASAASDLNYLLTLFDSAKKEPSTKEFAAEFLQEPVLQKKWEDFKQDQLSPEPQETLQSLVESLGETAEFRKLVSKFSQDPGFKSVLEVLAEDPKIKRAIASEVERAKSEKLAPKSRSAFSVTRGSRPQGGGAARASPFQGGPAGSAAAAPSINADQSRSTATSVRQLAGEPGEHAVSPTLAKTAEASSGSAAANSTVFEALCRQRNGLSEEECRLIALELPGVGEDVWAACFKAGLYDRCLQSCRSIGGLPCGPGFVESCRRAGGEANSCREQCLKHGECADDGGGSEPPDEEACKTPPEGKTCQWVKAHGKCLCYRQPPDGEHVFTATSKAQCQNKGAAGQRCVFNDTLSRCWCYAAAHWDTWKENCEQLTCKFVTQWNRCVCASPPCPEGKAFNRWKGTCE